MLDAINFEENSQTEGWICVFDYKNWWEWIIHWLQKLILKNKIFLWSSQHRDYSMVFSPYLGFLYDYLLRAASSFPFFFALLASNNFIYRFLPQKKKIWMNPPLFFLYLVHFITYLSLHIIFRLSLVLTFICWNHTIKFSFIVFIKLIIIIFYYFQWFDIWIHHYYELNHSFTIFICVNFYILFFKLYFTLLFYFRCNVILTNNIEQN